MEYTTNLLNNAGSNITSNITSGVKNISNTTTRFAYDTVQSKKLYYSAIAALVFLVISLPQTYTITDSVSGSSLSLFDGSCPTPSGKFLHTAVFLTVLYFIIKLTDRKGLTPGMMFKYAFYSALIFFVLSSSDAYALTSNSFDGLVNAAGCPTKRGVFIHSIVYLLVILLVMYLPECQYA